MSKSREDFTCWLGYVSDTATPLLHRAQVRMAPFQVRMAPISEETIDFFFVSEYVKPPPRNPYSTQFQTSDVSFMVLSYSSDLRNDGSFLKDA